MEGHVSWWPSVAVEPGATALHIMVDQEAENKPEGPRFWSSRHVPSNLLPAWGPCHKHSMISPKQCPGWGLSTLIHRPWGSISHSNHHHGCSFRKVYIGNIQLLKYYLCRHSFTTFLDPCFDFISFGVWWGHQPTISFVFWTTKV